MNTSFFQKIRLYMSTHKIISSCIALVIVVGGYMVVHAATKTTPAPTYVIGQVQRGTIVSTVTSSGQIATSDTVELKPQVSGPLSSIRVKAGDKVTKGQVLFTIQATDAARAVQTARDNLASAQLELRSTQSQTNTNTGDLAKAVKNAYITLLSSNLTAQPADTTTAGYQQPTISGNYTLGKEGTITITTYSSQGGISFTTSGLVTTFGLTNTVTAQPIGDCGLYIVFPNTVKGGLTWTISIPNKNASSYLSNQNAYENALENQNEAADPDGSTAVSLQSKQLSVSQAQNSLASAQETLANYTITSPFTGILASVPVSVGDQVSSGTTLGTVITNQEVATLSLNEVDVSKVKVGDKATLTFDAVDGLSLAGTVSTVDPVGTVSSGVVNYAVTISLDTQDDRVKSGMTVTAAIETAVAQDVLTVPSGAVKTINGISYVAVVAADTAISTSNTGITLAAAPTQTPVQIGITDGTYTEITSGLNEGDKVVTKTVAASASAAQAAKTTTAPSLLGGGGSANRTFSAGAVRTTAAGK